MARNVSRVAHGTNNGQRRQRAALDRLRERVRQVTLFEIAACRDVRHANFEFIRVCEDPLETFLNMAFGDAAGAADLHQRQFRVRRDSAIEAAGQFAIPGRDKRKSSCRASWQHRLSQATFDRHQC